MTLYLCAAVTLSSCTTSSVKATCPIKALPEQYNHQILPLPDIKTPTSEADIGVIIKNTAESFNQCRIGYNALLGSCERLLK